MVSVPFRLRSKSSVVDGKRPTHEMIKLMSVGPVK